MNVSAILGQWSILKIYNMNRDLHTCIVCLLRKNLNLVLYNEQMMLFYQKITHLITVDEPLLCVTMSSGSFLETLVRFNPIFFQDLAL